MADKMSDKIFLDLRRRIILGEIGLNSILVEKEVASEYAVSRVTAREALQRLCQSKYLINNPRKGYTIYQLSSSEVREIKYVRYHLEMAGYKLINNKCMDEDIERVRDIVEQPDSQVSPEHTVDARFHLALAELSGNQVLVDTLRDLILTSTRFSLARPASEVAWSHLGILDALLERDLDKAGHMLMMNMSLKSLV